MDNVELNSNFDKYFSLVYYAGGYSYLTGKRYDFNSYTMEKCTLDHFDDINEDYYRTIHLDKTFCMPKNYSTSLKTNGTHDEFGYINLIYCNT